MKPIWNSEEISKLINNCENLDINELSQLFKGKFSNSQIEGKVRHLGLKKKKIQKRKFGERRPQPNRSKHNPYFFNVIDNKEKADLLGLWVSDGWMVH